MPLLECLRGSLTDVTPDLIDRIVEEQLAPTDNVDAAGETKTRTRAESRANAENQLGDEARLKRWKNAHQFCKAVAPRRIKDFKHPYPGSRDCEWQYDMDGNQVYRLRKIGDPDEIVIRSENGQTLSTETKPYSLCFPFLGTHWQLADFGIGVGLYYTILVVWMVFLALLFLINVPAMFCNKEFKRTMVEYKTCRGFNISYIGIKKNITQTLTWEKDMATCYPELEQTPNFCLFNYPNRYGPNNLTTYDHFISNQDYEGAIAANDPAIYDYGGSFVPVTLLQGITECVCMFLMIIMMVSVRRFEENVEEKFDLKSQTSQDYSIRISGVLPRDPKAYQTYFDNMLKQYKYLKVPGDPATSQFSNEGVVRVTVLYDIDKIMSSIHSNTLATRAYDASHLHYVAGDMDTVMNVKEQKEGYYLKGKNNKPTFSTWLKTKLGCTKFGYYATIHARDISNKRLDQSIQELKTVDVNADGTFVPIRNETTHCQEDDLEMAMYRLPIFAFVTFNLEAQQKFILKKYDERQGGFWKKYVKRCGRASYALELYRDHVDAIGKGSPYLVHPLPEDTSEEIRTQTSNLANSILEEATCVEAEEPSDIDWTKQGYLTGKMPLGDPDLSWAPRPGSTNKYRKKCCSNIVSYIIAALILVILFYILLTVETQAGKIKESFEKVTGPSAYLDRIVGWVLAGTVTIINAALPIIMKQTVFAAEISSSETERQTSLVIKLSLVRICNSVLLIFLVSAYTDMLTLSLVSKISSLLILDIVLGPVLRMLDIYNLVMRYCVAKKAATQASMNSHFNGTYWNLAERYTDVTKTFFLCFFYSAISPTGYGLAFCAMFVNYFVDKYLLLRRWRVPPNFNATMSNANRYFQYLAVLSHACIALWFYRNWPFECTILPTKTDSDMSNVQLCKKNKNTPLLQSGFSKTMQEGDLNFPYYVAVLILLIICIMIIFYYFCFKVLRACCDQCFNCVKTKIVIQTDITQSDKEFLDIEHPDWYYPRLPSIIEANSPHLMSDVFDKYYHDQLSIEHSNHGPEAKWQWPAQLNFHERVYKHEEDGMQNTCDTFGIKCFQSSLMIEHLICHRRDAQHGLSSLGVSLDVSNPQHVNGPTVSIGNAKNGPAVSIGGAQRGVLAFAMGK